MGDPKPKRNHKQSRLFWQSKFVFSDNALSKFKAIKRYRKPVITDAIISDLEVAIKYYRALKKSYADSSKPSEIRANIDAFQKTAEAMIDKLNLDTKTIALIKDNFVLTGATGAEQTANWYFFDALPDKLNLMIDATKIAQQQFTAKKFPIPARRWLAGKAAEILDRHGVKPTGYNDGPLSKCLKICLHSTGDVHDEDISRLVKSVVKERKTTT